MRPESIRRFDLLFLASLAISAASAILGFDVALHQAQAEAARSSVSITPTMVGGLMTFVLLFMLLLWFLISRKGYSVAKWILVVLFLIGLKDLPDVFTNGVSMLEVSNLLVTVLQGVAIWYLFQPDAKAWFAGKRDSEVGEAVD